MDDEFDVEEEIESTQSGGMVEMKQPEKEEPDEEDETEQEDEEYEYKLRTNLSCNNCDSLVFVYHGK